MFSLRLFILSLSPGGAQKNLLKKINVMHWKDSRPMYEKSVQTMGDEVAVVGSDRSGDDGTAAVNREFDIELVTEVLEYFLKVETLE